MHACKLGVEQPEQSLVTQARKHITLILAKRQFVRGKYLHIRQITCTYVNDSSFKTNKISKTTYDLVS